MRWIIVLSVLFSFACTTEKIVYSQTEQEELVQEPINHADELRGDWFFVQRYQGQTYHHLYGFEENLYEWVVYQPVNEYETKVVWSEKGIWTYGENILMMEIIECPNQDFVGLVYEIKYEFRGQYLLLNGLFGRRSDNG